MLRLSTAGSVDDGKSTLIGRLLYDSKGVYEDQLASVRKASVNETAGTLDFALLTDGLRAEREQGITIDVAYRYFSTPKRKFIIADTPGHEQYTRNMATGASTANLAIILIDARNGVLPQSRRHAYIASLLGIPHIVVAINKMDLVDFREAVFEEIRAEFAAFAAHLRVPDLHFIPISALLGDNVVDKSRHMPWFEGSSLLHYLESVHIASDRNLADFRFPVQYVIRPNLDFRGYAGQVASGIIERGDSVMILPSGRTSRVRSIVTYDGELAKAFPPMSVTVCLEDEVDVSRGDMLVPPSNPPDVSRRFEAMLVWMSEDPLEVGRAYWLKHTSARVQANITAIRHKVDVNHLERLPAERLNLNEIGAVAVETHRPLFFDPYSRNRGTGGFILIDSITNVTVAAGMITAGERPASLQRSALIEGLQFETSRVTPGERYSRAGHRPATVWLTAHRDLAYRLERKLFDRGCLVQVLAEDFETHLLPDLARISNAAGLITICSAEAGREEARQVIERDRFIEFDNLPESEEEAVEFILQALVRAGVMQRQEGPFVGGEGI